MGVFGFKSAGDWLIDAASAIAETKYNRFTYRKRQGMDVIKLKDNGEVLNNFMEKTWTEHRIQKQCVPIEWFVTRLVVHYSTPNSWLYMTESKSLACKI